MVNYLFLLNDFTHFSKKDIDVGNTPLDIYKSCSCLREAFCLSYNIRKQNNVFFFLEKDMILIKFIGEELRYFGSDERSQALLLKKALDKVISNQGYKSGNWMNSTPGIYGIKLENYASMLQILKELDISNTVLLSENIDIMDLSFLTHVYDYPNFINSVNELTQEGLMIVLNLTSSKKSILKYLQNSAQVFPQMLENIFLLKLKGISLEENKILYLNYQIDHQDHAINEC